MVLKTVIAKVSCLLSDLVTNRAYCLVVDLLLGVMGAIRKSGRKNWEYEALVIDTVRIRQSLVLNDSPPVFVSRAHSLDPCPSKTLATGSNSLIPPASLFHLCPEVRSTFL